MAASPHPDSFTSFGELLRFLRRRAGLTQEALGRAVGYTGAHIGRLESNQRLPDLDSLAARFAPALHLGDEPHTVARLLSLAAELRGQPLPDSYRLARSEAPAPAQPASPPPPETPQAPAAGIGLAAPLSSFIGRRRELAEVRQLVAGNRLVTLLGAGGSGKTRLAVEAVRRLMGIFPNGVWLVELAPVGDPALVEGAVAAALDVPVRAEQAVIEVLRNYLREREALLVLDNCEHIVDAAASLAEDLLQAAPGLALLATSREPLRAAGEVLYRVPPLSLPDRHAADPQSLAGSEAAQLFVARAQAADGRFRLTERNAAAVAEICRRVDGLPLGLELAAARIGALGARQIAARLAEHAGLRLLSAGRRTAQARQQTLEALIDWSYVLLDPAEQALLRRLAAGLGSWRLDAIEAISAGTASPQADVADLLAALVDKCLVIAEEDENGDVTGYRLLEPIRQFALARLEQAGEWAAAHDRHLAWWAAWMEASAPELRGANQVACVERIEAELNQVRAALDWGLDPRADFNAGLRLAVAALGDYALIRGYVYEGLRWARAYLARATAPEHRPLRAQLLGWAVQLAYFGFEYEQGLAWGREGASLCRELGDGHGLAEALWGLGVTAAYMGDHHQARAWLQECAELSRELHDPYKLSFALVSLGRVHDWLGEPDARDLVEQGLALANRSNDTWGQAHALLTLGDLLEQHDEDAAARPVYERNLAVAQRLGDRFTLAAVHTKLAIVLLTLEDHPAALRSAADALALYRELGDVVQQPFCLRLMGFATLAMGQLEQAEAYVRQSLVGNRALAHETGQIACLLALARLAHARGLSPRAGRLAGWAQAILAARGLSLMRSDTPTLNYLGSLYPPANDAPGLETAVAWALENTP
jgi:predicted ATPase/transcriptional regulator with XRE-family HTH domain